MKHLQLTPTITPRLQSDKIDAAKGALILLIILGHASNFWTPEPFATFSLKFFHVACFLLLPFIYDIKPPSIDYLTSRVKRYYLPFVCAVLIYGTLYSIAIDTPATTSEAITRIIHALTIANAPQLDAATGLRSLWFLPVLISITILNSLLIGTKRIPTALLLAIAFIAHITIGSLNEPVKSSLPFGMAIAAYLFFIGLIMRLIYTHINHAYLEKRAPLWLALALTFIAAANLTGSIIKFPVIALPDYTAPLNILIHDAIIIFSFMTLASNSILKNIAALKWLGRHSLSIYLGHLGFMAASNITLRHYIDASQITLASTMAVTAIFAISLLGGIACTKIIQSLRTIIRTEKV